MNFVTMKINEVNELALKLGLDKCSEIEKSVFRDALFQIASAAIEDTRSEIGKVMSDQMYKYSSSFNK